MAKRRRRKIRLGSAAHTHLRKLNVDLNDLENRLRDLDLASTPRSCELVSKQLHGAYFLYGNVVAHSQSGKVSETTDAFIASAQERLDKHAKRFRQECVK